MYIYVCMYIYIYTSMLVYICMYVCIYIYAYTHMIACLIRRGRLDATPCIPVNVDAYNM